MNSLLDFNEEGNKVIISPDLLSIEVFYKIWRRDKTGPKKRARGELSLIWYTKAYTSPYVKQGLSEEDIIKELKTDSILSTNWKMDDLVKEGLAKYEELNYTQSMYLLNDAKVAVNSLRNYFKDVNLLDTDKNGKPVHNIAQFKSAITSIGEVNSSLKKLEKEINKELADQGSIRGGEEIDIFENPDI